MFGENSPEETNPTQLAVTASVSEIPPVPPPWPPDTCVSPLCSAKDDYYGRLGVVVISGRW